jgi:hypothetical protein
VFEEDRSRYQRPQCGFETKIDAGDGVAGGREAGNSSEVDRDRGELFAVLERPYLAALIDTRMRDWLKKLMAAAELVKITERIVACRDGADDRFFQIQKRPSAILPFRVGVVKPKNRKRI